MPERIHFDAAVLAGGKSTRFGRDKALLDWRGAPLYERQLRTLAGLRPRRLWLSANANQEFPDLPEQVTRITDDEPGLGPIGGLLSLFRVSEAEFVLVLGVDLPLMESDFLERLLGQAKAGRGVVPVSDRFWEPLAALYPREAMLRRFEEASAAGERKLQHVLGEAHAEGLIERLPVRAEEAIFFTNLNSTNDWEALSPNRADDEIRIRRYRAGRGFEEKDDHVAAEEPLEIRVNEQSVAVMMRTPGHDEELATGFLFTESLIRSASEIFGISHLPDLERASRGNTLEVRLHGDPDLSSLTRHVFTSSSCGVCGKATIDSVFQQFPPLRAGSPDGGAGESEIAPDTLLALPDSLRAAQDTFERTGGLHASALFTRDGELIVLREDVGRHNALDKVIGNGLRDGLAFEETVLLVSGRISFELMQKALAAGIRVVAGISAPSSLAVELARESGQILVGFLREKGFNVYAGNLA